MAGKYLKLFQEFGLSPNEALIFEILIIHSELPVAEISRRTKVHRRNVYDALQRLLEKGLVYEVLEQKHSLYQAVEPQKLLDLLEEKRTKFLVALPDLQKLYQQTPPKEAVLIYRGAEGLKNYMRDIIRSGKDYYSIGAKGIWADPRAASLLPSFLAEAKKKNIKFKILYDYSVELQGKNILTTIPADYRFLPKNCNTPASLGIFGDVTVVLSDLTVGKMNQEISFTVITNKQLTESLRSWFNLLWESRPAVKGRRPKIN